MSIVTDAELAEKQLDKAIDLLHGCADMIDVKECISRFEDIDLYSIANEARDIENEISKLYNRI